MKCPQWGPYICTESISLDVLAKRWFVKYHAANYSTEFPRFTLTNQNIGEEDISALKNIFT